MTNKELQTFLADYPDNAIVKVRVDNGEPIEFIKSSISLDDIVVRPREHSTELVRKTYLIIDVLENW